MANIKSQKKRIRQDAKRNLRNKSIKTELKSSLKSLYSENGELIPENKIAVLKS
jgi:ribosomal protein S20